MATYDFTGERVLLQQIAHGNEMAFKSIFDLYNKKVFSFVVHYVHSTADAEEIVQDTFMTLWVNRSTLTEIEHPRNYIYTIARNKTYNYLAKVARNEKMLQWVWANMRYESNETEDMVQVKESSMLINNALDSLPCQKRQIFCMSRHEGMDHESIARMLGLSKSRVKNVIVEVTKFLRSEVAQRHLLLFVYMLLGLWTVR